MNLNKLFCLIGHIKKPDFQSVVDSSRLALVAIFASCSIALVAIADVVITEPFTVEGMVVGAAYTPSGSNQGIGIGSSGKTTVFTTQEHEKWTLVIDMDGKISSFNVRPNMFYKTKVGELVKMGCRKGVLVGIISCFNAEPL